MRSIKRRDWIIIGIAILGVVGYVVAAMASGGAGFPLDDSWIHQVYGRSVAATGQWAFVPGVPSAASTSPLYTVLLALGYGLRVPFFAWTYGLGAVGLAAAGVSAGRLGDHLAPDVRLAGLACGLLTVTSWHFVWAAAAGMETIIFCALTLGLIGLTWRGAITNRAGVLFGIVGALTTLARPEGAGLFGLCGLFIVITRIDQPRRVIGWLIVVGVAFVACMMPYLLLNIQLNGTLLPNTSEAKQAETAILRAAPYLERVWTMTYPLVAGGQLVLLPGVAFILIRFAGWTRVDREKLRLWVAPLWALALILLYAWRLPAPYQHGRYVIPALAPFFVLGGAGMAALVARRTRQTIPRVVVRTLAGMALVGFPVFWAVGLQLYVKEVRLIDGEMVLAARWIAENVPPSELLAVHDIGAVGYFAPRPLFDLAGLITPEVVPIITDTPAVMRLMEMRGVRWLMASTSQLPTAPDDPRLCPMFETPGAETPIHMTVYRIAWDGRCG